MTTPLGKVMQGATPREFVVASSAPIRDEFVEVPLEQREMGMQEALVAQIVDCVATNVHFNDDRVFYYLNQSDPSLSQYTLYRNTAQSVAILSPTGSRRPDVPPPPGATVHALPRSGFEQLFGRAPVDGVVVGVMPSNEALEVVIRWERLFKSHLAAIGHTGSGKTWLAKLLLTQVSGMRKAEVVVVDPAGEYRELARTLGLRVVRVKDLKYPLRTGFIASAFGLNLTEVRALRRVLEGAKQEQLSLGVAKGPRPFDPDRDMTLTELAGAVEDATGVELRHRFESLNIVLTASAPTIWAGGRGTVLVGDQASLEELDFGFAYIADQIRDQRANVRDGQRLVLVVEETHNFAPSVANARSRAALVGLAREGRKSGVTLILVTQRPRHVDPTVLSQCGTMFLFRMQNTDDVNHVMGLVPASGTELKHKMASLWTGECIVAGDALDFPLVTRVLDTVRKAAPGAEKEEATAPAVARTIDT